MESTLSERASMVWASMSMRPSSRRAAGMKVSSESMVGIMRMWNRTLRISRSVAQMTMGEGGVVSGCSAVTVSLSTR